MDFGIVIFIMLIPLGLIVATIINSAIKAKEERLIRKEQVKRIKAKKKARK